MKRSAPRRGGSGLGRRASGGGLPAPLALLMLALALPAPADAQPRVVGDDGGGSRTRIRRGILALAPSLEVDRIGVETNIFNAAEPQSDFVVALRPRLDASVPLRRRATLATTFIGGVEHYRTFGGERSFNPNVRARVDVPLRRFSVFVGGNYLRTRERYDYAVDLRARRSVSDVNGRVSVALSPKLALAVDLLRERWRFDADARFDGTRLAETLDRDERAGTLTLSWRRTALSSLVLVTEYREARFLQSPGRNGDSLAVLAGGEFDRRALIAGSVYAGVRRFTAIGPAVSDAALVVLRANLSYRLPENTTATFEAERDIGFAYRPDDPIYLMQRYGVGVTHRLGPSFDVTGRVDRSVYDYLGGSGRRDRTWMAEGSVGYLPGPATRIGFRVAYRGRKAATPPWSYGGIEAGLVLSLPR